MKKRLNYNIEVDNLTKINDFFQNAEISTHGELEKGLDFAEQTKVPKV